jgi:opacity protein-like surface antigen
MTGIGRITRRAAAAAVATTAVLALAVVPATAAPNDAALARQGTAGYHDSSVITNDSNWFQLFDLQGITCIDDPAGAMGIHFVNGARVGDPTENAAEPEAVIYEPTKNGRLRLVAVEYVVTKQAWEGAGNTGRPHLFGQDFEFVPAGNRYGLPDFYELHAWIWRHNPSGMNEDWNPLVTCAYAS